jgi:hypothetical protein
MKIRLEYDDNIFTIIGKINEALEGKSLELVFDNQEHDGFEILTLEEKQ